jgi:hypothetical protein
MPCAIKAHVAAKLRAERRGGELLVALAGKAIHLPIGRSDREKWRNVAALAPKDFER